MSGTDAHQHVNVVRSAIDDQRRTVHFANDTAEISEKIAAKVGLDQRAPALRGEDQMQQNIAGCMGHFSCAPPGLNSLLWSPTHGLRRGLHSFAASRLVFDDQGIWARSGAD